MPDKLHDLINYSIDNARHAARLNHRSETVNALKQCYDGLSKLLAVYLSVNTGSAEPITWKASERFDSFNRYILSKKPTEFEMKLLKLYNILKFNLTNRISNAEAGHELVKDLWDSIISVSILVNVQIGEGEYVGTRFKEIPYYLVNLKEYDIADARLYHKSIKERKSSYAELSGEVNG